MFPKKNKYSFLEFLQILSIDVVFGTLAIGYMATRILNVVPTPCWWIILALSVWVIYSLDHIVDSFKKKGDAVIVRHRFHYIYRKPILIVITIAGLISITLSILFLEKQIIYSGLILTLFIAIYLCSIYVSNKKKTILLQKELYIALVYTTGIFLAPIYWYQQLPPYPILLIIFIIFILAWFEGIMISWFDYDNDINDGHCSFTVIVGKKNTRRFLLIAHSLIEFIMITALLITSDSIVFYVLLINLIMNLMLGLLILFPHNKISAKYHRLIGESIFLLPVLVFFV